ncbi:hypothetical protein JD844_013503 [Phrynosoma platyrhinos]|uniref:Uncharacterized protein n=1 Tax=Phrynosoma platyrhinos TaxID=52577 RepID=A0ABQ7TL01_PHRPL|nr:hypothetical protein JD844_013503 [Phrynosoma platyrhinos]
MGEEDLLTSTMLHGLLLPQLTELDLSICPTLVCKTSVEIIMMCCKNLSSLDLGGCIQIPVDALIDLVKSLPHLTRLNLSKTQCNIEVLTAVGSCCFGLRELDLSTCEDVTPESLLHLVYNPVDRALCCQELETLRVCNLMPSSYVHELVWALAFVLLALPRLKHLIHDSIVDAVCLLYHQHFDSVQIVPEFPSLAQLAIGRMSNTNENNSRVSLALREIYALDEYSWPVACTVCPHLEEVSMFIRDGPNWGQNFLSCGSLVHLTINCMGRRDLQELWPVTKNLGAQLHSLTVEGFSLKDELSLYTLLDHCQNLKKLRVNFFSSLQGDHVQVRNGDALNFDVSLPPLKFPQLSSFYLMHSNMENPLPAQHAKVLEISLAFLLKYSPQLENLDLIGLTLSLDEMFQMVLVTDEAALQRLKKLSLIQVDVSMYTIDLLLSSNNQLNYLRMYNCSKICEQDYEDLLQKVDEGNLDLNVEWE